MTRDFLIWAAGFVDGEGCVSVGRKRREKTGTRVGQFYWRYTLSLQIGHKSEAMLRLFQDAFGGNLRPFTKRGIQYWAWAVWSQEADRAIKQLLPYLRLKREVAEVGLRFQESMVAYADHPGRKGHPPEVLAEREAFYQQAKQLNAKSRANHRAPKYEGPRVLALKCVNEG